MEQAYAEGEWSQNSMARSSIHGRKFQATKIALDIPIALAGFEIRLRRTVGYACVCQPEKPIERTENELYLRLLAPTFFQVLQILSDAIIYHGILPKKSRSNKMQVKSGLPWEREL